MIASTPNDIIPAISHVQYERQLLRENSDCPALWAILDEIKDPEIPVVSLWDLGILQSVEQESETQQVTVTLTPTYSGCPAIDMIGDDIKTLLKAKGYGDCQIKIQLSPAWTTDWITATGKLQLQQFGIAPPVACLSLSATESPLVACPQCGSSQTTVVSEFGSTACKAAYQCDNCGEAFDYFKHF